MAKCENAMSEQPSFDQQAEAFKKRLRELAQVAESSLAMAADTLHGRRKWPDFPSPQSAAELAVRNIERELEEALREYDRVLEVLGMPPRFFVYFLLMELSGEDQEAVRRILEKYL